MRRTTRYSCPSRSAPGSTNQRRRVTLTAHPRHLRKRRDSGCVGREAHAALLACADAVPVHLRFRGQLGSCREVAAASDVLARSDSNAALSQAAVPPRRKTAGGSADTGAWSRWSRPAMTPGGRIPTRCPAGSVPGSRTSSISLPPKPHSISRTASQMPYRSDRFAAAPTLIAVLRQLRAGYVHHPRRSPQRVILCGSRDVRDYRVRSSAETAVITGGSAVKVKAESLRMATSPAPRPRRCSPSTPTRPGSKWTGAGRRAAWLVNALAYRTCEANPDHAHRPADTVASLPTRRH